TGNRHHSPERVSFRLLQTPVAEEEAPPLWLRLALRSSLMGRPYSRNLRIDLEQPRLSQEQLPLAQEELDVLARPGSPLMQGGSPVDRLPNEADRQLQWTSLLAVQGSAWQYARSSEVSRTLPGTPPCRSYRKDF